MLYNKLMKQLHQMGLQPRYFNYIKSGTKRIELRLNDSKRQQIQVGDEIQFTCGTQYILAKVKGKIHFDTFKDLFEFLGHDMTLVASKDTSEEEMLKVMEQFYPLPKQHQLGVVGLVIEPVKA